MAKFLVNFSNGKQVLIGAKSVEESVELASNLIGGMPLRRVQDGAPYDLTIIEINEKKIRNYAYNAH